MAWHGMAWQGGTPHGGSHRGSLYYLSWHGPPVVPPSTNQRTECANVNGMAATPPDDAIILRQSWLGTLAMCPERARQDWFGIAESTESSNTAIGTAVHYGIEQCLTESMQTGDPLS